MSCGGLQEHNTQLYQLQRFVRRVTKALTISPLQRPQTNNTAVFYPFSPPNPTLCDSDVLWSQQGVAVWTTRGRGKVTGR